jgi:hypothetical protein
MLHQSVLRASAVISMLIIRDIVAFQRYGNLAEIRRKRLDWAEFSHQKIYQGKKWLQEE